MIYLSFESEEGLKKDLDYNDERLWDSTQASTVAREEYGVRLVKICCSVCVNGHRSSKCLHYERPLMMVKERGQRKQATKRGAGKRADDEDEETRSKRPHRGNVFVTPILDPEQPVKYLIDEMPLCPNHQTRATRAACMDPGCCSPIAWGTLHIDMSQFKGFKLLHNQINQLLPDSLGIEVAPYIGGMSDMVAYRKWEDSHRGIKRSEMEMAEIKKRDVEISCSSKLADAVARKYKFVADDHLPAGDVRPLTAAASKVLTAIMSNINDRMVDEMSEIVGSPRSTEVKSFTGKRGATEECNSSVGNVKKPKKCLPAKVAPLAKPVLRTVNASTRRASYLSGGSEMPQDVKVFLYQSLNSITHTRSRSGSSLPSPVEDDPNIVPAGDNTSRGPGMSTLNVTSPRTDISVVDGNEISENIQSERILSPPKSPSIDPLHPPSWHGEYGLIPTLESIDLDQVSPSPVPRMPALFIPEDYETCSLTDINVNRNMTVREAVEFANRERTTRQLEQKRNGVLLQMRKAYIEKHGKVGNKEMVDMVRKACVLVSLPFDSTTLEKVGKQLTNMFRHQQRLNESEIVPAQSAGSIILSFSTAYSTTSIFDNDPEG